MKSPTFILLGAAGYVAPRHMAAIKAVGGDLVAAADPHDSVGVLDHYFPKCHFYTNIHEMNGIEADYCVVCLPNHLHAAAAQIAMRNGMNVILEKPAALSMLSINGLRDAERVTGKKCYCILQMRLHPTARLLKFHPTNPKVQIEYHTPRGPWYWKSWKGDSKKSGGVLFNIGVHLIDLALWAFGDSQYAAVELTDDKAVGSISFEGAITDLNLSINGNQRRRQFIVNDNILDFTNGFEDLHTKSYRQILDGNGFTLDDAAPAIELCERLSKNE